MFSLWDKFLREYYEFKFNIGNCKVYYGILILLEFLVYKVSEDILMVYYKIWKFYLLK